MNTCPQCHNSYGEDYDFCLNDGTRLVAGAEQETVLRPKVQIPAAGGPTVGCGNCGYENRAGSKFCKKCGQRIAAASVGGGTVGGFSFGAGVAPAFDRGPDPGYQETINVSPGMFVPPTPALSSPGTTQPRTVLYVVGGLAVGLLLLVVMIVALSSGGGGAVANRSTSDENRNTSSFTLPTTFTRSYSGTVFTPRGDRTLSMELTRDGTRLTGTATAGKTDTLEGSFNDDGSFDARAYEYGNRHTGYWRGRIASDGVSGEWTDQNGSRPAPFSMR